MISVACRSQLQQLYAALTHFRLEEGSFQMVVVDDVDIDTCVCLVVPCSCLYHVPHWVCVFVHQIHRMHSKSLRSIKSLRLQPSKLLSVSTCYVYDLLLHLHMQLLCLKTRLPRFRCISSSHVGLIILVNSNNNNNRNLGFCCKTDKNVKSMVAPGSCMLRCRLHPAFEVVSGREPVLLSALPRCFQVGPAVVISAVSLPMLPVEAPISAKEATAVRHAFQAFAAWLLMRVGVEHPLALAKTVTSSEQGIPFPYIYTPAAHFVPVTACSTCCST